MKYQKGVLLLVGQV